MQNRFQSRKYPGEHLDYFAHAPAGTNMPLIVYLHGAGNRGEDISVLTSDGNLKGIVKNRCEQAYLLAPQCHKETWFDLFHVLCELISLARQDSRVDSSRVYLIGVSMGGYAAWQLCISHPEWFAAAVPVCGGGMYWNAGRLKNLPVWAFHGLKDTTVLPGESSRMVDAINRAGGRARLTWFAQADHNAWEPTFASEEMWDWLFRQKQQE